MRSDNILPSLPVSNVANGSGANAEQFGQIDVRMSREHWADSLNGFDAQLYPDAATEIFPTGDGFEVGRIDARAVSTQMIQLQSLRDIALRLDVERSVCVNQRSVAPCLSVAMAVARSLPIPAAGLRVNDIFDRRLSEMVVRDETEVVALTNPSVCMRSVRNGSYLATPAHAEARRIRGEVLRDIPRARPKARARPAAFAAAMNGGAAITTSPGTLLGHFWNLLTGFGVPRRGRFQSLPGFMLSANYTKFGDGHIIHADAHGHVAA